MANGDDAILGGMTPVNGAAANSAPNLDDSINIAMDHIANGPGRWKPGVTVPVSKGGTGASTAANARTNLDVYPKATTVSTDGSFVVQLRKNGTLVEFWVDGVKWFHLP